MPQASNITQIRRTRGSDRAVVFIHGFIGARDDTWDLFPTLLGTSPQASAWDLYTIGYATTLLPDVVGVWSADPDLPILAKMLRGQLNRSPFDEYRSLALVAHSMGGLVVQQALVETPGLAKRVEHVVLFGTPSAGLRKAWWLSFWKRQFKNMAADSAFITNLRSAWTSTFGTIPPFNMVVVAGETDQFVPPESSLLPFDERLQEIVPGNHLDIVKPARGDAPSIVLLVSALQGKTSVREPVEELRLAAQLPAPNAPSLVQAVDAEYGVMTVQQVVASALALERAGKRPQSIELLERHQSRNTDIKGTLAGRLKRVWFESNLPADADRALALYVEALASTTDPDQIYYHAINVAFMRFVYRGDRPGAEEMARLALQHATPPGADAWKTATVAEAYLYLGRRENALEEYRRLMTLKVEPWKHQSAGLQASRIAAKLNDKALANDLEQIFTPAARQVNQIFVSYSHKDREWLDRLQVMVKPYLREAEHELVLWDDTRIDPGQRWDDEIRRALTTAGVVVALVSADFLASSYVMEHELPVMLEAEEKEGLTLLWVYISSAGWEVTPLRHFQAVVDTKTPLASLPRAEQDATLKTVAQEIKKAALRATDRFRAQPGTQA